MKLLDAIKLGFGFYIGYEVACQLDNTAGEIFRRLKEKTKDSV